MGIDGGPQRSPLLFFSAELGFGTSVIIRWCVYILFLSILCLAPDSVIVLQLETPYPVSLPFSG